MIQPENIKFDIFYLFLTFIIALILMLMPFSYKIILLKLTAFSLKYAGFSDDIIPKYSTLAFLGHYIIYFGLTLLALTHFKKHWFVLSFALILFAGVTESLQFFSDGRTPRVVDFFTNIIGVSTAAFFLFLLEVIRKS